MRGKDSERFLQKMLTNNISGVKDHRVVYSPMCYPDGGVVDDLLVYKYSDREYFVVVNAGNTDKSFDWLRQNLEGETTIENVSSNMLSWRFKGLNQDKSFKMHRLSD